MDQTALLGDANVSFRYPVFAGANPSGGPPVSLSFQRSLAERRKVSVLRHEQVVAISHDKSGKRELDWLRSCSRGSYCDDVSPEEAPNVH